MPGKKGKAPVKQTVLMDFMPKRLCLHFNVKLAATIWDLPGRKLNISKVPMKEQSTTFVLKNMEGKMLGRDKKGNMRERKTKRRIPSVQPHIVADVSDSDDEQPGQQTEIDINDFNAESDDSFDGFSDTDENEAAENDGLSGADENEAAENETQVEMNESMSEDDTENC